MREFSESHDRQTADRGGEGRAWCARRNGMKSRPPNALLKSLEEPPPEPHLILASSATVASASAPPSAAAASVSVSRRASTPAATAGSGREACRIRRHVLATAASAPLAALEAADGERAVGERLSKRSPGRRRCDRARARAGSHAPAARGSPRRVVICRRGSWAVDSVVLARAAVFAVPMSSWLTRNIDTATGALAGPLDGPARRPEAHARRRGSHALRERLQHPLRM